jgi:phage anti-repressor protein
MNQLQLINVKHSSDGIKVDGRELHEFLEVGRDFTSWIKQRIEQFGFSEGDDYKLTLTKTGERQNVIRHDYELSLDMAKELCMVENNDRGKEARRYFIECERRGRGLNVQALSPQLQLLIQMEQRQLQLEAQQKETEQAITVIQETFLQRDEDWRKSINSMLNGAVYRMNGNYRDVRNRSYEMLEERGHCKLDTRLRNLVERLEMAGATKTQLKNTSKMDVIEADPKLKEIYGTIVKELSIGSLKFSR